MEDHAYPKMYLYKRVVQAKLYIENHYAEPIDIQNIADNAYFSKFHFIRLFKSIYQKTPHQYLISVRIDKARQLLTQGKKVSESCFAVGFDSPATFSILFKKHTGLAPKKFQMKELKRLEDIKDKPLVFVPNCYAEQKGWVENSNSQ